jgi:hypothetical protein
VTRPSGGCVPSIEPVASLAGRANPAARATDSVATFPVRVWWRVVIW